MEEIAKYFTVSDRFLLLGAEKIYLQFFIEEIGQLEITEQVKYLISNLSEPGTNFPYLCSLYYLITEHKSALHESGNKQVAITLKPTVMSSNLAMAAIDHCIEILAVEVPKEEEMIHFRIKVILDLAVTLLSGHYSDLEFQLPHYPGLLAKGINFCFKTIKLSQERMDIDLRRVSALLLLLLKIKFRDRLIEVDINAHEQVEDVEKIELFEKMKKLVDLEEEGKSQEAVQELIKQCHYFDVEEWFQSIITEASNPLPTVLVVGYLRALLNLVTTTRAKNTNGNFGFDCSSELESTYNYMTVYLSDLDSTEALYKSKVTGNKSLKVKSFLFNTMAFDKMESLPEINNSYLEMKLLNLYKDLYSKNRDILPDSLSKELEEAKEGPTANIENATITGLLINEIYSHRISTIYFITRTLSLIHRVLRSNNFFQSLSLGNYIYDAKGILVMLKIISEKILQHEGELNKNAMQLDNPSHLPVDENRLNPIEGVVEDILYLFFHITYDYPDLVNSSLNEYKAHYALKKYPKMFPQNKSICNYTYLIIKKQMDLMPKKVKGNTANMSIVSHNYNAVVDMDAPSPASFVEGIDGPARSARSIAESSSSFVSVSSMNTVKHFLASTLRDVADQYVANPKFDYTHETAKKLCSAMNHLYNKQKDRLPELMKARKAQIRQRTCPPSVTRLYNEMYASVQVPENFDLFYEQWLDQEVYGYFD